MRTPKPKERTTTDRAADTVASALGGALVRILVGPTPQNKLPQKIKSDRSKPKRAKWVFVLLMVGLIIGSIYFSSPDQTSTPNSMVAPVSATETPAPSFKVGDKLAIFGPGDLLCQKSSTITEYLDRTHVQDDLSKPLPGEPECIDAPYRFRVVARGKHLLWQGGGYSYWLVAVSYNGKPYWFSPADSLIPQKDLKPASRVAMETLRKMRSLQRELERARFKRAFWRCGYGACTALRNKWHERILALNTQAIGRELLSNGITVMPVQLWIMGKDYYHTQGEGNDFTRTMERQLRYLYEIHLGTKPK